MKDKKINYNNFLLVKKGNILSLDYIASYKNFDDAKKACNATPDTWVKYNGYKVFENETILLDNIIYSI